MRLHRYEVEAQVPHRRGPGAPGGGGHGGPNSLPQIRRQVERICELLDIEFDDLDEMHIVPGQVTVTLYQRDARGELYRNDLDKIAIRQQRFPVDTSTFLGDERDI